MRKGSLKPHICRVFGCRMTIAPNRFVCYRHWTRVPHDVRDRIYVVWKAYEADPDSEEKLNALRAVQKEALKFADPSHEGDSDDDSEQTA